MSEFEIENITELPNEILHRINCFLNFWSNVQLMYINKLFYKIIEEYGLEGIKEFQIKQGITNKYYQFFDILSNKTIKFKSIQIISLKLYTMNEIFFLQKLIKVNKKCLSKLYVHNSFIKYDLKELRDLGIIIKNKNLTNMIKLKCINFNCKALMWIECFVFKFKNVSFEKCSMNQKLFQKIIANKCTIKFYNVYFVNMKQTNVKLDCAYLKVKITQTLLNDEQYNIYKHLLSNKYEIVQCDCLCSILKAVLPKTVYTQNIWKFKNFKQILLFLHTFPTFTFDVINICEKINYNHNGLHYRKLCMFAELLLQKQNYNKLVCNKEIISITYFESLLQILRAMIREYDINENYLKPKMSIFYVVNDIATLFKAQAKITVLKKQYKFLSKIFSQIFIINSVNKTNF